jgi:hypothetical protein
MMWAPFPILFPAWVTSTERYWVTSGEQRSRLVARFFWGMAVSMENALCHPVQAKTPSGPPIGGRAKILGISKTAGDRHAGDPTSAAGKMSRRYHFRFLRILKFSC